MLAKDFGWVPILASPSCRTDYIQRGRLSSEGCCWRTYHRSGSSCPGLTRRVQVAIYVGCIVWAFSSVGLVHEDHAGFHTDMPSVNGNRLSTHPASNRHTSIAPIVRSCFGTAKAHAVSPTLSGKHKRSVTPKISGQSSRHAITSTLATSTEAQTQVYTGSRYRYRSIHSTHRMHSSTSSGMLSIPCSRTYGASTRGLRLVRAVLAGDPDPAPRSPRYVSSVKWQPSRTERSSKVQAKLSRRRMLSNPEDGQDTRGNFIANCQLGPFPGPSPAHLRRTYMPSRWSY